MTGYRRLPAPTPLRRSFTITLGLTAGYQDGSVHDRTAAVDVHIAWMLERIAAGAPYLPGLFTDAVLSYAWPRPEHSGGKARTEMALVFAGEVSTLYQSDLPDRVVEEMLDELAARLGAALGQTRVYVAYREATWVLQAEGELAP